MGGFRDAGLQRPLNRRLGEVLGGVGVSSLGNTAGTTGTVFGPAVLVGVSGVSLSQSTQGQQATISIIASAENGVAIGAGTQTASTGTVVFSNSNNVTFGLSGQTLTASAGAAGPSALAAGTQTATSGTIAFSNSNNVTFGMSNSSVVTASIPSGATATGNINGIAANGSTQSSGTVGFSNVADAISFGYSAGSITGSHNAVVSVGAQDFAGGANLNVGVPRWVWASSAGFNVAFSKSVNGVSGSIIAHAQAAAIADSAQTATSGTVVFSNSNGVSFGLSGSSQLTASISREPSIAAGTQTASSGTIVFSNSAIEFGMSGSTRITAQPKPVSYIVNNGYDRGVFLGDISVSTAWIAPWYIYAPVSATRLDLLLAVSNSSSAGGTVSMDVAFYTLTGSTANSVLTAARSWAYNSTLGSNSSYTQVSGTRYRSMSLAAFNFTPGQYLVAFMYKLTTGLTSGTYQAFGGRDVSVVGNEYPNALGTGVAYWNGGFYSASTTALPASIHVSDIASTGSNDVVFVPFMTLAGTF